MNIAVCFKVLPDYQMVTERDWQIEHSQQVDLSWTRQLFNCYEESALELALQLAAEGHSNLPGNTTALTIDDDRADLFLRQLYATGYDHGVRIDCGPDLDLRFNPLAVSLLIASYVQRIGNQQLVVLGAQGGLGDHQQTGYLVAERLGWPCLGDVVDVTVTEEPGLLRVTSRRDKGVISQTVALPLVLVIGNVLRSPYLRIPTLKDKLASKTKTPVVLTPEEMSLSTDQLSTRAPSLITLEHPPQKKDCTMITGTTVREKAQSLFVTLLAEGLLQ